MKEAVGSWMLGICQTADILRDGYKALGERFMKMLHVTAAAFLLAAAVILCGCTEQRVESTANTNSGSDVSGSSSLQNESLPNSVSSMRATGSTVSVMENSNILENKSETVSTLDYSHLNIPTEFTEEDRELQKVLRGLVDSTDELTCCFGNILTDDTSVTYKFIFSEEIIPNNYYLVPKNFRYREGSTFTVPTTYSEWSEAFHRYFTEEATESWLKNVGVGTLTENSDGTFGVSGVEQPVNFLELDGKMYCWEAEGGRKSPDINVKTAKVKSKTEDTITFSYLGYNYIDDYINFPEYSYNSEGVLKLEGDSWKLDFFYGIGFNHD